MAVVGEDHFKRLLEYGVKFVNPPSDYKTFGGADRT